MSTQVIQLKKKDVKGGFDPDPTMYTVYVGSKLKFQMGDGVANDWKFDHSGDHPDGVTFGKGGCPSWLKIVNASSEFVTFEVIDGSCKGDSVNFDLLFKNRAGATDSHDPGVHNGGTD